MSRIDDKPTQPAAETLPSDIDDTVDAASIALAEEGGELDSDIDEGAFTDEPEALSVMVEDDLDEAILAQPAQPADPFDRIAVRKAEKPFHGELPPKRDDEDL